MISNKEFEEQARQVASVGGSQWELNEKTDIFGTRVVYLKAVVNLSACSDISLSSSSPSRESKWDDDEDTISLDNGCGTVEYFITYNDAYRVPELYFRGCRAVRRSSDASGSEWVPINCIEEWNTLFFGDAFDTDGLTVPTPRPIVGAGYCEVLGLALFSLHQCDTADMLKMSQQQGVRDLNSIRVMLRMVASLLRLPGYLLL